MSIVWSPPLKVWHNGVEWVVADAPKTATQILVEHFGYDAEEAEADGWEEWLKPLTVTYDDIADVPEDSRVTAWFWAADVFDNEPQGRKVHGHNLRGLKVTAPPADWVRWNGAGFLCSTEA